MIPYCPSRASRAARCHRRMQQIIEEESQAEGWPTFMSFVREGTFHEDYFEATDYHALLFEREDMPTTVQFKVQHSRTFYTWTVQLSCWHMTPDFYAFYHEVTGHLFVIAGYRLKQMSRSLYDGPNSNQPFYYGPLTDLIEDSVIAWDSRNNRTLKDETNNHIDVRDCEDDYRWEDYE